MHTLLQDLHLRVAPATQGARICFDSGSHAGNRNWWGNGGVFGDGSCDVATATVQRLWQDW